MFSTVAPRMTYSSELPRTPTTSIMWKERVKNPVVGFLKEKESKAENTGYTAAIAQ